uniref:Proprotein convertase subtilisin/kexin type 5 n=1 Tax=Branchiostoma californiense TaxID=7738 RepID=PCSK5_BRACL|nr:RecName: Full=Proprotein convertase subtilisin/kexin type 5; AltName: Full=Proprotein convertase PC6-like; Short=aPC6; Flags: Precursor [Branchiostoma californiense]AAF26301.1 proprotein convertase aPC6B isoform [Branchiostoma californiense]
MPPAIVILALFTAALCAVNLRTVAADGPRIYRNEWALHVEGGTAAADRLASKHGFINKGQIGSLEDHYLFVHRRTWKRSLRSSSHRHALLQREPEVRWLQQQVVKRRVKRRVKRVYSMYPWEQRVQHSSPQVNNPAQQDNLWDPHFNDEKWDKMWYLHCDRPEFACQWSDMNVEAAWKKGYTGKGVVVSILDDGSETDHPDLAGNYDPDASSDINGGTLDPTPRYEYTNENRHGTRCAGEVAAMGNNSFCSVGVAYKASIGGVRMLDGDVTDSVEAASLGLNPQHIMIYSASWGPDDDGKTVDGPANLAQKTFQAGAENGRDKLGSIFVWASGNGGRTHDSCGCDGYTNSIYTISVSSASEQGKVPWYLEPCASTLATTYSSGAPHERKVITTDLRKGCTESHTGTSASAPMAAGILALALEANPMLTWRDMQYIVVMAANPSPLDRDTESAYPRDPRKESDFVTNGAGLRVSHNFGFGLMDAGKMVELAESWRRVPEQHVCEEDPNAQQRAITKGETIVDTKTTGGCNGTDHHVKYLEHVVVEISLDHPCRGHLSIHITSPSGTRSTLLPERQFDSSSDGLKDWAFMTTHCWGEQPEGDWILEVKDLGQQNCQRYGLRTVLPVLRKWKLILYGTAEHPLYKRDEESRPHTPQTREEPTDEEECEDGDYYDRSKQRCRHCHDSCATCHGRHSGQCLSCHEGNYFVEDEGTCSEECGQGYYKDEEERKCLDCSADCLTCQVSADHCTSCDDEDGLKLFENTCVAQCSEGRYMDENDVCQDCDDSCDTCTGPDATDCVTCADEDLLQESQCVESCSSGYFQQEYECLKCHATCASCSGSRDDQCLTCSGHLELDEDTHRCITSCEDGEYGTEEGKCEDCNIICKKCNGSQADQCLECHHDTNLYDTTCVQYCGNRRYPENGECHPCHPSCLGCIGGEINQCNQCITDYEGEDHFLYQGTCHVTCPPGLYGDTTDQVCKACAPGCIACDGPADNQCTLCEEERAPTDGRCQSEGSQTDEAECAEGCHSCEEGPDICDSCDEDYYLTEDTCVRRTNCPSFTYPDDQDRECRPCHDNCEACDGPNNQNCNSCKEGFYKTPDGCSTGCPNRYYKDDTNKECKPCDSSCFTCSGPASFHCLSCADGDFLHESSCRSTCPAGFIGNAESHECVESSCEQDQYYSSETGRCEDCPYNCRACDNDGDCAECAPTYIVVDGRCRPEETCEDGEYQDRDRDTAELSCRPCHQSCKTCSGPSDTDCDSCKGDDTILDRGECITSCGPGEYMDRREKKCKACHPTCKECSDEYDDTCTACNDGFLLTDASSCEAGCPPGQFLHHGDCDSCHRECKTCDGPHHDNCLSCQPGSYLNDQQCSTHCPEGTFEETYEDDSGETVLQCRLCHVNCKTCHGEGEEDCMECANDIKYKQDGRCVTECQEGHYPDLTNECQQCWSDCETCDGPRNDQCVTCPYNYYLVLGKCLEDCPEGYYDTMRQEKECGECHPSCATCNEGGNYNCLSCPYGSKLGEGVCYPMCEEHEYYVEKTQICEECDNSCKTCRGSTAHDCLSCEAPYGYHAMKHLCTACCEEGSPENEYCCICHESTRLCITDREAEGVQFSSADSIPTNVAYIAVATFICVVIVVLFFVVFGMLQARSNGRLCWAHKYQQVPTTRYEKMNDHVNILSQEDFYNEDSLSEDEIHSIDSTRH